MMKMSERGREITQEKEGENVGRKKEAMERESKFYIQISQEAKRLNVKRPRFKEFF